MGIIERKDLKYEYSDVAANGDDRKKQEKEIAIV